MTRSPWSPAIDNEQQRLNWDEAKVIGHAKTRHAYEFIEAWHSTNRSINKDIDLDLESTNQQQSWPPPHQLNFAPCEQPVMRPIDHNTTQDLYKQNRNRTKHFTQSPAEDVT